MEFGTVVHSPESVKAVIGLMRIQRVGTIVTICVLGLHGAHLVRNVSQRNRVANIDIHGNVNAVTKLPMKVCHPIVDNCAGPYI